MIKNRAVPLHYGPYPGKIVFEIMVSSDSMKSETLYEHDIVAQNKLKVP